MSQILAGKPYILSGITITPLVPVPQDKGEDIFPIQKRGQHIIYTIPDQVQRRWETQILNRLPIKPTLSPFRFRGRICFFLNDTTIYEEDKEPIANLEDGFYHGKVHFCFPSIHEKNGDKILKIKPLSIMICKEPCPW